MGYLNNGLSAHYTLSSSGASPRDFRYAVKMNCCYEMRSITISDETLEEAVDVGDKNRLQDLIVTAVNDATSQVDTITKEAMNSISRALGFSTMG